MGVTYRDADNATRTGATKSVSGEDVPKVAPVFGGDSEAITPATGAGAVDTGTQRTTLASNDPAVTALQVMDDWDESDRAKVNPVVGQAGVAAGAGAVSANTQRVTHASDDPVVAALAGVLSTVGPAAVVSANFTRPNNTTAYSSGQIIANNTVAGSCSPLTFAAARTTDAPGCVRRLRLKVDDTAWLNATVRLHLFKDSPTFAAGDGGTFAGNISESGYLGYADISLDQQFSSTTVKGLGVAAIGGEINFAPSSGTANIFGVLECRASVSPAASKTFTGELEVLRN